MRDSIDMAFMGLMSEYETYERNGDDGRRVRAFMWYGGTGTR